MSSAHYHPLPPSEEEFDLDDSDDFKPIRHSRRRRRRSVPPRFPYVSACVSSVLLPLGILRKARRFCRPSYVLIAFTVLFILQVTLNTSYLYPPHFHVPVDETVFIAANIVDGDLVNGAWGQSLIDLVNLIGPERSYVSVYGGPADALKNFAARLPCENSIVAEESEPINLQSLPTTELFNSSPRIKRIAFLAEARNRALRPLDTLETPYSRILFLNDVFFNPQDAIRLLWGTNVNEETGKAEYKAACGADFVTSWKYYDTFATRDTEGFSMGLPVFPWFSNTGEAVSRRDVLDQKSAVRVKSCWGGIVAFDGRYFHREAAKNLVPGGPAASDTNPQRDDKTRAIQPVPLPIRFRAVAEPFWEASECCLIHADLMAVETPSPAWGNGIYLNPYVRVSYDATSHARLWVAHRFERLAVIPQRIISYFAKLPRLNARREEIEGQVYTERVWAPRSNESRHDGRQAAQLQRRAHYVWDPADFWHREGHFVDRQRTAGRGGYCGVRALMVLRESSWDHGNWETLDSAIPPTETEF